MQDDGRNEPLEILLILDHDALLRVQGYINGLTVANSAGLDGAILAIITGYMSIQSLRGLIATLRSLRPGVIIDARAEPLTVRTDRSLPRGSITIRQSDGSVEVLQAPAGDADLGDLAKKLIG